MDRERLQAARAAAERAANAIGQRGAGVAVSVSSAVGALRNDVANHRSANVHSALQASQFSILDVYNESSFDLRKVEAAAADVAAQLSPNERTPAVDEAAVDDRTVAAGSGSWAGWSRRFGVRSSQSPLSPTLGRGQPIRMSLWDRLSLRLRERVLTFTASPSSWGFLVMLGFCCSLAAWTVNRPVEVLQQARLAYTAGVGYGVAGWFVWTGWCITGALIAVSVGHLITPYADGSGLPQMKSMLAGTPMPGVLSVKVFLAKWIGLVAAQGGGLSVGKEGPFVHMASCIANAMWSSLPSLVAVLGPPSSRNRDSHRASTANQDASPASTSRGAACLAWVRSAPKHTLSVVCGWLSSWRTTIGTSESKQRTMLAAAVAAGVTAVFGTPIGGVLFAIEVTSTIFPLSAYFACFVAAILCRLGFDVIALLTRAGDDDDVGHGIIAATAFPASDLGWQTWSYAALGIVCGLMSSGIVFSIGKVIIARQVLLAATDEERPTGSGSDGPTAGGAEPIDSSLLTPMERMSSFSSLQSYLPRLSVAVKRRYALAACVAFLSSTLTYLIAPSMKSELTVINDLFSSVSSYNAASCATSGPGEDPTCYTLVDRGWVTLSCTTLSLLLFVVVKCVSTVTALSLPMPSGLFVPLLVIGAAIGRVWGEGTALVADVIGSPPSLVHPGSFAVVGAASLVSGATHTVSTAVIVFELTGQISHLLPVLLATLLAYATASVFTISVYDLMLLLSDLPYLPRVYKSSLYTLTAGDIMRQYPHAGDPPPAADADGAAPLAPSPSTGMAATATAAAAAISAMEVPLPSPTSSPLHPPPPYLTLQSTYRDLWRLLTARQQRAVNPGSAADATASTDTAPVRSIPVVGCDCRPGCSRCAGARMRLVGVVDRSDAEDFMRRLPQVAQAMAAAQAEGDRHDGERAALVLGGGSTAADDAPVQPPVDVPTAAPSSSWHEAHRASHQASGGGRTSWHRGIADWLRNTASLLQAGPALVLPDASAYSLQLLDSRIAFTYEPPASSRAGEQAKMFLPLERAPLTLSPQTSLSRLHFLFASGMVLQEVLIVGGSENCPDRTALLPGEERNATGIRPIGGACDACNCAANSAAAFGPARPFQTGTGARLLGIVAKSDICDRAGLTRILDSRHTSTHRM